MEEVIQHQKPIKTKRKSKTTPKSSKKRKRSKSETLQKELQRLIDEEPIEDREDEAIYRDKEDFMSFIKAKRALYVTLGEKRAKQFLSDIKTLAWSPNPQLEALPTLEDNFILFTLTKFLFKRFYTQKNDKDLIKNKFKGKDDKKRLIEEEMEVEKLRMKLNTLNLTPEAFLKEYHEIPQFKRSDEYRKRIMSTFFTYIERTFNKEQIGPEYKNLNTLEKRFTLLKFFAKAGFEEEIGVFEDQDEQPSLDQLSIWFENIFCTLETESDTQVDQTAENGGNKGEKKAKGNKMANRGTDKYSLYLFEHFPDLRCYLVDYMEKGLMEGREKRIRVDLVKNLEGLFKLLQKEGNKVFGENFIGRLLAIGDRWNDAKKTPKSLLDLNNLSEDDRKLVEWFFDKIDQIVNRDKFKFIWTRQLFELAREHYRRKSICFMVDVAFKGLHYYPFGKKNSTETGVIFRLEEKLELLKDTLESSDRVFFTEEEKTQSFKNDFELVFEEYEEVLGDINRPPSASLSAVFEEVDRENDLVIKGSLLRVLDSLQKEVQSWEEVFKNWYSQVYKMMLCHKKKISKGNLIKQFGGGEEAEALIEEKLKADNSNNDQEEGVPGRKNGSCTFSHVLLEELGAFLRKVEITDQMVDFLEKLAAKYRDPYPVHFVDMIDEN